MSKKKSILDPNFYETLMKKHNMKLVRTETFNSTRTFLFFSPQSKKDIIELEGYGEIQIVLYYESLKMIPVAMTPALINKEKGYDFLGSPLTDGINISISEKSGPKEAEEHISEKIGDLYKIMSTFRDNLTFMQSVKISRKEYVPFLEDFLQRKHNLGRGVGQADNEIDFIKTSVDQYLVFDKDLSSYLHEKSAKTLFHYFIMSYYYLGEVSTKPFVLFEKNGSSKTITGSSKGARVLTSKVTLPTSFMKFFEYSLIKRREFNAEIFSSMLGM